MPLSTFSSDIAPLSRPIPPGRWLLATASAVALLLAFIAFMETSLSARGFDTTIIDSDALWLKQRQEVSDLGAKALILVGASRIQLDLDLDVLRAHTKLVPVQLAVDGSSFTPVLDGLAKDVRVTGTLLVGYQDDEINSTEKHDRAAYLEKAWEQYNSRAKLPDFASMEATLGDALHHHLRSYADGARPVSSLMLRILDEDATPQYLVTRPDRSRLADYRSVAMPAFYYTRVMRNLDEDLPLRSDMSWSELDATLQQRIDAMKPVQKLAFGDNTRRIAGMVKSIEQRGGRVIFLVMPRSGMVKQTDEKRFPRATFWNEFASQVGAESLNVEDHPALGAFQCPDGSHLDYRDRARFSETLAGAIVWGRSGAHAGRGR